MKYIGLCALVKHEELYIADWVKYHLGIGIDQIILYVNDSPDRTAELAMQAGGPQVIIHNWPGHPVQHTAHEHCLATYRRRFSWLAFIDADEYFVIHEPFDRLLPEYANYPALCPHWVLFGSNGHKTYSPEPVPERFTRCQQDVNRHVKTICQPTRTGNWITAHRFIHDMRPVQENFQPIEMLDSIPMHGTINRIYIAHYFTKSLEEFTERRSRPRPDTGEIRYNLEEAFAHHDRNERENFDVRNIWRQISETK